MKIIPLSEGSFTVDKTKSFIPFDTQRDDLQERSQGSLLVEIQPFCIVTKKDVIVIDTGLGFVNKNGVLQIHQNLIDNQINPLEVTKVLVSHLHKDHAGGIFCKDEMTGQLNFSFPAATYYINKEEFAYAMTKGQPSYKTEHFELLGTSDKIIFTEGDGVVDDYIQYRVSAGHAPFHQVFQIEEEGQIVFFGGDVAPQLQQMKNRFIAKYDYDGRRSMELRQEWWQQAKEKKWAILFYHDIKTPIVYC